MTRAFAAGLLAAALLGGWRASLLHPLEHVDEQGRFVHIAAAPGSDARGENDRDDGDPSDRLGDSLAALAACAAAMPQLSRAGPLAHDSTSSAPQGAPRIAEAPPFLSQGPPAAG